MNDIVRIRCYNQYEYVERKVALPFYEEAMFACEGSEMRRYVNVVAGLKSGRSDVSDGEKHGNVRRSQYFLNAKDRRNQKSVSKEEFEKHFGIKLEDKFKDA